MNLTDRQIRLIKMSWRSLQGIPPALIGDIFYSRLFTEHPGLRKMFPKNMEEQHAKLMDMLTYIVKHLDQPEILESDLTAISRRHAGYGVQPKHYLMAGQALLWTLQKCFSGHWTEELQQAWTDCYRQLTTQLQETLH